MIAYRPAASGTTAGSMARPTDEELVRLYERHRGSLWRLGLRMAGDAETAADLVQETFVRAMTGKVPRDPSAAEAWMVRILVNLSRDLHRWRKVRRTHAPAVEAEEAGRSRPENPESRALARLTVQKAMLALPPKRRAVLALHDLEGVEPPRIGELLGMRPATVRWHLAAARRELKAAIEEDER